MICVPNKKITLDYKSIYTCALNQCSILKYRKLVKKNSSNSAIFTFLSKNIGRDSNILHPGLVLYPYFLHHPQLFLL